MAFVGSGGGEQRWMKDEDEQCPKMSAWVPSAHTIQGRGNSRGDSFVHVGGFPTPG